MGRDSGRMLRVLAADDSAVMRGVMRTLFDLHASQGDASLPKMELCGMVRDGIEALEAVKSLAPDVLLLDLEMPRLGGIGVLEQLRTLAPGLPVIMCSAYTERGARSTLDALSHGAKDYVMKPGQQRDFAAALDMLMEQLLPKIAELTRGSRMLPEPVRSSIPRMAEQAGQRVELVVIGVSTGGPSALEAMLPLLPVNFAVPVLIVQHMPKLFTGALAQRLDGLCALQVKQAWDGAPVEAGRVWLAPGDAHMEVAAGVRGARTIKLHRGPMLNSCMPSVDYLFRSAAEVYGAATLAVVMTGMGSDGLEGSRTLRAAGGAVLVQDEASSAVWGMPGRVAGAGLQTATVSLEQMAGVLMQRTQAGRAMRPTASGREVAYGVL